LTETLRIGLTRVIAWCRETDPGRTISLSVLSTNGGEMVGSCLNRSLWYPERGGIVRCEIRGRSHVRHDPKRHYRAVEIASEPITREAWPQVPNGTVFAVDPDFRLRIGPLGPAASAAAAETARESA